MNIVFMGTPEFAVKSLEALVNSKHEVSLVITQPDKAKDRGKKIQFTPVKELALANDIAVSQPIKVRDDEKLLEELKDIAPDIIVVVAYGQILPKEILELPKYGCINVHASLLPKLRGAAPIQRAIMEGHKETGITIMQMGEGLDTGDMLLKDSMAIGNLNYQELHNELANMGAALLTECLEKIQSGDIMPQKQDDRESTYARMIFKQDGKLDFGLEPDTIDCLVRGLDPWPGAFCTYKDQTMKIWKCKAIDEKTDEDFGTILKVDADGIMVSCGGKKLLVTEIQVPGKKRVEVKEFIKGNSIDEGIVLQ